MIEYTAIRQSLFLWYSHNANIPLTYETIREHIVIISRMTGYDDDDIREYLENSFASSYGIGATPHSLWELENNYKGDFYYERNNFRQ